MKWQTDKPAEAEAEIRWRDLTGQERWVEDPPRLARGAQLRPNLYEILEVSRNASPEVIKAAYRALMAKYHPDKHPEDGSERAEEISRQLNEAYSTLSNAEKRGAYDVASSRTIKRA